MRGNVLHISRGEALDFVLPRHYSGRAPQITKAFGWYINDQLVAVCTFGKPASNNLCFGIAGHEYAPAVFELNRLCRIDGLEEPLSAFVSACLRRLRNENWIVVSYADSEMNHNGYIYQACNFLYTGKTKERTDKYTPGNKHSRHAKEEDQGTLRKVRSAKHRYIYFCSYNKKLIKQWRSALRYEVMPYPKGENKNYILGQYLQPKVINTMEATQ